MGLTLVPVGVLVAVVAAIRGSILGIVFGVALALVGFLVWRIGERDGWWDPSNRP